jgi:hypothetical protein
MRHQRLTRVADAICRTVTISGCQMAHDTPHLHHWMVRP